MPDRYCVVVGCHNSGNGLKKWKAEYCSVHQTNYGTGRCICDPPFRLFNFPTELRNAEARRQWTKNVHRQDVKTGKMWIPSINSRVCSKHFVDGEPTELNPHPTLSMGHSDSSLEKKPRRQIKKHDHPVIKKRKISNHKHDSGIKTDEVASCSQMEIDREPVTNLNSVISLAEEARPELHQNYNKEFDETDTQTSMIPDRVDITSTESVDGKPVETPKAKPTLPIKISLSDKLMKNDKKCKYYTGLPSKEHFELILNYVQPKVEKMAYWRGTKYVIGVKQIRRFLRSPKKFGPKRKVTIRDELFMVLMKLRLGLMTEDLADRFGISSSTVSSIFNTWIKVLSMCLKRLIFYPDKICAKANLPECFVKSYPRLRCIIDCTEFFIDRPRELYLQAVTWSDYKKHNTVKVLIGISPRGNISFVSDAWGGRASDRHITLHSDFLDHIDPGDQIMADRGFLVREEIMMRRAELIIPPAAKGAQQMSAGDVRATKEVANLRIHVERAIQRLKTFKILKYTLPLTLLPVIDNIIITCAALCNLYGPLIV